MLKTIKIPVYLLSFVLSIITISIARCQDSFIAEDERITKNTTSKWSEKIFISGTYPHLAMFNAHRECGAGAILNWADRLWVTTYSPHVLEGANDKLYEITPDLTQIIRPEYIGGTDCDRMIHKESNQVIVGPYFIDKDRNITAIHYNEMYGRLTGVARHLTDPENKVYFATMEEGLYEVDVHTKKVKTIFEDGNYSLKMGRAESLDPKRLPGYHGKGLYAGEGKLFYSNNGEYSPLARENPDIPSGSLAEYDGDDWKVIRRNQFTEITGPGGIYGGNDNGSEPVWSIGWDHKSLLLMVLDNGKWSSYRLPKASHSYDGAHGWNTEWPRIRDIEEENLLMTMHGMAWKFPKDFSSKQTKGILPRSSYLRMVVDFVKWKDKLVMACNDAASAEFLNTSELKNPKATSGQSNSNLWFIEPEKLDELGPPIGRGGVWMDEDVKAGSFSEPYLFENFDHRMVHISHEGEKEAKIDLEIDKSGKGNWELLQSVTLPEKGYEFIVFAENTDGIWIRVKTKNDLKKATIYFEYSNVDNRGSESDLIFDGLAKENQAKYSAGTLWSLGAKRRNLAFNATVVEDGKVETLGYYELNERLELINKIDTLTQSRVNEANPVEGVVKYDDASMIIRNEMDSINYRLPKSHKDFNYDTTLPSTRIVREIVTERDLVNYGGTFYELPARNAGGLSKIKPISTHNYNIYDYSFYRGLFVMSGLDTDVSGTTNEHIVVSKDKKCSLWVGAIDDLWGLGKPRGIGGPWNNTRVEKGKASDPYLMSGYDNKSITIEHASSSSVEFDVEVDIAGNGMWKRYKTFQVAPGDKFEHKFPKGFSAYWVRIKSNYDCVATAIFKYN